jgi:hypothetical protein
MKRQEGLKLYRYKESEHQEVSATLYLDHQSVQQLRKACQTLQKILEEMQHCRKTLNDYALLVGAYAEIAPVIVEEENTKGVRYDKLRIFLNTEQMLSAQVGDYEPFFLEEPEQLLELCLPERAEKHKA